MSHIKHRPILITGANGGIGSRLVEYLLDNGYVNIMCQYHNNKDLLEKTIMYRTDQYGLDYGRFMIDHTFKADLTNPDDVARLHQHTSEKIGKLWALINLAGSSSNAMSWKMTPETFMSAINANLLTTFLTSKEFIPELRDQGGGRIINTSSVVAFTGTIGAAHYCAAKAGIVGLTKSLALELANKNITVNCLALGYFDCGMITQVSEQKQTDVKSKTPLGRFGKVKEIGALIEFLISDGAAFTTGQVNHMNGGFYL
jgi:NAD(P)-dependent dehydrogenase (short-subunit alcohol dehydrogenase family)